MSNFVTFSSIPSRLDGKNLNCAIYQCVVRKQVNAEQMCIDCIPSFFNTFHYTSVLVSMRHIYRNLSNSILFKWDLFFLCSSFKYRLLERTWKFFSREIGDPFSRQHHNSYVTITVPKNIDGLSSCRCVLQCQSAWIRVNNFHCLLRYLAVRHTKMTHFQR